MAELFLRGRRVENVFQLLGDHENDITYSVGWALTHSASFLQAFLDVVVAPGLDAGSAVLRLQEFATGRGITDIEIEAPGRYHIIVEAKRGWTLPTTEQLALYAPRLGATPERRLVVLSECRAEFVREHLPVDVSGTPVVPLSWRDVAGLAARARRRGTVTERRVLDDLDIYLRGLMTMQKVDSNWVYVVSLSGEQAPGWGCSWIEIVARHRHYTHAVGTGGWPKEPPNYLAVRFEGRLQSIHHVERYDVVTSLVGVLPQVYSDDWNPERVPQFLYWLGAPFRPDHDVPTGAIFPNGRVWCMLDTLFTAETIAQARDLSRERAARAGEIYR